MKNKKKTWSEIVRKAFSPVYALTQIADIPKKHIKKLREIEDAITEDAVSKAENPIGLTMKEETGEVPIR
jgi:hypothetical protein